MARSNVCRTDLLAAPQNADHSAAPTDSNDSSWESVWIDLGGEG